MFFISLIVVIIYNLFNYINIFLSINIYDLTIAVIFDRRENHTPKIKEYDNNNNNNNAKCSKCIIKNNIEKSYYVCLK